jgi:alkylated DNA repair dioxygenase AlkB
LLPLPPWNGRGLRGRLFLFRATLIRSAIAGTALLGTTVIGSAIVRALLLRARGQRQCEEDDGEANVTHGSPGVVRLASLNDNSIVPHWGMAAAGSLFGADLPPGFLHQDEFISTAEEAELIAQINRIEFATFEMRGVVAKRRVAFFGASYDRGDQPSPPIPEFLDPVRERLAAFAGVKRDAFAMALINEYRPGAPIGWHRDAPQYDIVAGVSVLSECRMRLRPYLSPAEAVATKTRRMTTHEIELLARSAYVMRGEARSRYEHSIPAVAELRYSITFRTLR